MLKISFIQSETLASGAEFLRSFLRRHFAWKPAVASRNVGCFQAEFIQNESIKVARLDFLGLIPPQFEC